MSARRLSAVLARVRLLTNTIAALSLAAMVVLTTADVVGRYFFSSPLHGATEMTEFGIALVVFSALPAVTWGGKHIAVDLLDRFFSPRWRRCQKIIANLLFASCLSALGARIWLFAERDGRREVVSEYLSVPLSWIQYYIAVICFVTAAGALFLAFTSSSADNES